MAGANWSEAGVRVRLDGTVEPGHHWRVREVPGGAYWLSVYKDDVGITHSDNAGDCLSPTAPSVALAHGEMRLGDVRIWAHKFTLDERYGVALIAWHIDKDEWMAAVSVSAYDDRGRWLGCDALVADVALGWMAGEMAARDPERWPALRAAMVEAMAATTRPPSTL